MQVELFENPTSNKIKSVSETTDLTTDLKNYISAYNQDYIKKITQKLTKEERSYLGMSQLGNCSRELIMTINKEPKPPIKLHNLIAFRAGYLHEEIMISDEKELSCLEVMSCGEELEDTELKVKGHYDSLVKLNIPENPKIHGMLVVKDYKALNTDSFINVRKINNIRISNFKYFVQLQSYMHWLRKNKKLDIEYAMLHAADKGRGITFDNKGEQAPAHIEIIKYDANFMTEIEDKIRDINFHVENKTLPSIPEDYSPQAEPCIFCGYKNKCFDIPEATQNTEKFSKEDSYYLTQFRNQYKATQQDKKDSETLMDILKDNIDNLLLKNKQKEYIDIEQHVSIRKTQKNNIGIDNSKALQLIPNEKLPLLVSITTNIKDLRKQLPETIIKEIVIPKDPTTRFYID